MKIFQGTCRAALLAAALFGATGIASAQTQGTIKIGVLHSLSGTMAISETTLKDTILMMVDDINKKGSLARRSRRSS
jgi:urea transport system substrate-binding protein